MIVLALESSAKAASAAIVKDRSLVGQYFQCTGFNHSRTLLQMAESLLKDTETRLCEVDKIAVSAGPGSFTGIRIGVSAAKGLAWGAQKGICAVSTLEAMAYSFTNLEGFVITPVMDARLSQLYNAKFLISDGNPIRICEDRAISMEDLKREIETDTHNHLLVGDGAELAFARYRELSNVKLASSMHRYQTAAGVAFAAYDSEPCDPGQIQIQYLRLSQAERERLRKTENP